MLKIRQEQVDAFAKIAEGQFKQQLQEQLRIDYAKEVATMNEAQLKVFVDTGVDKAKAYKIVVKRDVANYLVILLYHGVNFEQQPEHHSALSILTDPEIDGEMKLVQLKNLFENNWGTYA